MKKIAKISLVAAIAVAGFTTANAQPLEEAIKNVDVTGSVVYRYNDSKNNSDTANTGNDKTNNNYKVALNLASKVNENVKFNSRFTVGQPASNNAGAPGSDADSGFATLDSTANGDQNVGVELSNAYFGYTGLKNTTVNVGKQGLTTPWTVAVDSDGNEQTGTGILALSAIGPVTLAGAYFNQTNLDHSTDSSVNGVKLYDAATATNQLDGAADIVTVGVIGAFGPVTADAWYLNFKDTFGTYTLGAKAKTTIGGIELGADARYASLSLTNSTEAAIHNVLSSTTQTAADNSIAKLALTADAGLLDGKLAYAKTGSEGGLTALDNDASTTLIGWNLNANGKTDADYIQAVVGVDILSNLNLSANYGNIQYIANANSTTDVEEEEIYAQLLYKMSKNLSTYVRYGEYTKDTKAPGVAVNHNNDDTRGRLQVEYTF